MLLAIVLAILGAAFAAPFVMAILRSVSAGRILRIWLIEAAAAAGLWGASALLFHGGLIPREHRLVAALIIHGLWAALTLAVALGAIAAAARAVHLRTSGK